MLEHLDDTHPYHPDESFRQRVDRRGKQLRRRRRSAATAAVGLLVLGGVGLGGAAYIDRRDAAIDRSDVSTQPSTDGATNVLVLPQEQVDEAWQELPAGPLGERLDYSSTWTGRELIIWGGWSGTTEREFHADGAAFNPSTNEWRMLPGAPDPGRASATGVWTGTELLILGGINDDGPVSDGLGFNPTTGNWRQVDDGPLGTAVPTASIWTGTEVIIIASSGDVPSEQRLDVTAYSPSTDAWSTLPPPANHVNRSLSVQLVDGDILLFGSTVDDLGEKAVSGEFGVQVFDLGAREWRSGPTIRLSPQSAAVESFGPTIVAVDYLLSAAAAGEPDDVEGQTWEPIASVPLRATNCSPQLVPAGRGLLMWYCGQAALLTAEGTWLPVTPSELASDVWNAVLYWSGDEVLLWGRLFDSHAPVLRAFKPHKIA